MSELHFPHAHDADENPAVHHEASDVNIRAILGFGLGLFVVAVIVHLGVWGLFRFFEAREAVKVSAEYPLAAAQADRQPPEPRLQVTPREDLQDLRANEDAILNGYGWVDKNNGIVRIPIEEAMRLTLARGLPSRQERSR